MASLSLQGHSSIGRASVSKTEGWGFETLCPCQMLNLAPANQTHNEPVGGESRQQDQVSEQQPSPKAQLAN